MENKSGSQEHDVSQGNSSPGGSLTGQEHQVSEEQRSEENQGENQEEVIQQSEIKNTEEEQNLMEAQYPQLIQNITSQEKKLSDKVADSNQCQNINKTKPDLIPLVVCEEDESEMFPTTFLQSSPKGFKPIKIKIETYTTTAFMKIETQIFNLDISNEAKNEEYQIQRRFSDFADLYEEVFYNHPGYIMYPFPGKNLESFIKIKLGLGAGDSGQRNELIEKRMQELENFINYLTYHPQISNCQELKIFLLKQSSEYEQQKKRTQKYVEQYKGLQKVSEYKYLFEKGVEFFRNYNKQEKVQEDFAIEQGQISHKAVEFATIYSILREKKKKAEEITKVIEQLFEVQKKYSEFHDIETDIDILLKVCAKHSSSRDFCKKFVDVIEIKILEELRKNGKYLEEIEKSLMYRLQMIEVMKDAQGRQNKDKFSKLQRRLERFEHNFVGDWKHIIQKLEQSYQRLQITVLQQWHTHKKSLSKIWKLTT